MNWLVVLALACGNMALKLTGVMIFAHRPMPQWLQRPVGSLPLAIYPALVAAAVFGHDGGMRLDGRVLSAGAVLLVLLALPRKNVFGLVMLVGAGVTALIHFLSRAGVMH
jgi:branched-subunit amino acid transport protein